MPRSRSAPAKVFLNVPYDKKFEKLFVAYIAGIAAFGFAPRATLEIRKSSDRLDKILELIRTCEHSIHDLSRVESDRVTPQTPRFNMPFELGLTVAWSRLAKERRHKWFVFESVDHRLQKALSDLNGIDPKIHNGRIGDIFIELRNIFTRPGPATFGSTNVGDLSGRTAGSSGYLEPRGKSVSLFAQCFSGNFRFGERINQPVPILV